MIKDYNIPLGAHVSVSVDESETIQTGQMIAKIPRATGKARHITGGLLV